MTIQYFSTGILEKTGRFYRGLDPTASAHKSLPTDVPATLWRSQEYLTQTPKPPSPLPHWGRGKPFIAAFGAQYGRQKLHNRPPRPVHGEGLGVGLLLRTPCRDCCPNRAKISRFGKIKTCVHSSAHFRRRRRVFIWAARYRWGHHHDPADAVYSPGAGGRAVGCAGRLWPVDGTGVLLFAVGIIPALEI